MRREFLLSSTVIIFLLSSLHLHAQVPVSKEPRHKPVFVNKYFRVLDVWLSPGDTTLYHIHSTPSFFLRFTSADLGIQKKDKDWEDQKTLAGQTSFSNYAPPDTLIHRVCNNGTTVFHVTDIEIISTFQPEIKRDPLPIPLLFENEMGFAYKYDDSKINKTNLKSRGPMLAELVSGNEVYYHDVIKCKQTLLKPGRFIYISPDTEFKITATGADELNLVLFELK